MEQFFNLEVDRLEDVHAHDMSGHLVTKKARVVNTFPTLSRFAALLGVTKATVINWAKAKNTDGTSRWPDFFYAYARARDCQEALLIEGGMAGLYDPRFAVIAAKNVLGWRHR